MGPLGSSGPAACPRGGWLAHPGVGKPCHTHTLRAVEPTCVCASSPRLASCAAPSGRAFFGRGLELRRAAHQRAGGWEGEGSGRKGLVTRAERAGDGHDGDRMPSKRVRVMPRSRLGPGGLPPRASRRRWPQMEEEEEQASGPTQPKEKAGTPSPRPSPQAPPKDLVAPTRATTTKLPARKAREEKAALPSRKSKPKPRARAPKPTTQEQEQTPAAESVEAAAAAASTTKRTRRSSNGHQEGQMVIVLERKGDGWAEEIFPSWTVKESQPEPRQKTRAELVFDSAKLQLVERLCMDEDAALELLEAASSWRVTKKGRSLVDRKLRKTVVANVPLVIDLVMGVYRLSAEQARELLQGMPALLIIPYTDDWVGNFFEYLLRARSLLPPTFRPEDAFRVAETAGAAHLTALRPVKPIEEWVEWQLTMKTQGRLGEQRVQMLELAGMEWGIMDDEWEECFDSFVSFRLAYGDADVDQPGRDPSKALVDWISEQRMYYCKGVLPNKGIERLELLGLDLDPIPEEWAQSYEHLKAHREKHDNVDMRGEMEKELRAWLHKQRKLQKEGQLSAKRATMLEELGVEWDLGIGADWERKFAQLQSFHQKYGHANVSKTWEESPGLGLWVEEQRMKQASGNLAPEFAARLTELGVDWDLLEDEWDAQFKKMVEFRAEHGHCEVPRRDPELGEWSAQQRNLWRDLELEADRIAKLEGIGFVWDHSQGEWDRRVDELDAFSQEHGHCCVPQRYEASAGLGMWVSLQRRLRKEEKLPAVRTQRLDALGFEWEGTRARESREKIEAEKKKEEEGVGQAKSRSSKGRRRKQQTNSNGKGDDDAPLSDKSAVEVEI